MTLLGWRPAVVEKDGFDIADAGVAGCGHLFQDGFRESQGAPGRFVKRRHLGAAPGRSGQGRGQDVGDVDDGRFPILGPTGRLMVVGHHVGVEPGQFRDADMELAGHGMRRVAVAGPIGGGGFLGRARLGRLARGLLGRLADLLGRGRAGRGQFLTDLELSGIKPLVGLDEVVHAHAELGGDCAQRFALFHHMPAAFTGPFAKRLDGVCQITVKEAEDGERLQTGVAYVAPGGKHLRIDQKISRIDVRVVEEPREALYKPSASVLFDAVALGVGRRALGVVLTGMHQAQGDAVEWGVEARVGVASGLIAGLLKVRDSLVKILSVDSLFQKVLKS